MVSDQIQDLLSRLAPLNRIGAEIPALKLDLTWPSIGTLDRYLSPLRNQYEINESQNSFLQAAAGYIGILCQGCWTLFPDGLKVELALSDQGDVILAARGGLFASEGAASLNLSAWLRTTLLSSSVEIFPDHRRRVLTADNILSNAVLGLLCGHSAAIDGPWRNKTVQELGGRFQAAEVELARQSAEYYRRVFPIEKHGALSTVFTAGLILPPLEYREPFPAQYGVKALLDYTRENSIDVEALGELALNLAMTLDDTISSVGLAVACALSKQPFPRRLLAAVDARAALMPYLRPAYLLASKMLELPDDWSRRITSEDRATLLPRLEKEARLRLIPALELPAELLLQPELETVLQPLAWNNASASLSALLALDRQEVRPELDTLEAGLLLQLGEGEAAIALLTSLLRQQGLSRPLMGRVCRLLGHASALTGETKRSQKFFSRAVEHFDAEPFLRADCLQALSSLALLDGNSEEALRQADRCLSTDAANVTARIIRISEMEQQHNETTAQQEILDLGRFAYTDTRVIGKLLSLINS